MQSPPTQTYLNNSIFISLFPSRFEPTDPITSPFRQFSLPIVLKNGYQTLEKNQRQREKKMCENYPQWPVCVIRGYQPQLPCHVFILARTRAYIHFPPNLVRDSWWTLIWSTLHLVCRQGSEIYFEDFHRETRNDIFLVKHVT